MTVSSVLNPFLNSMDQMIIGSVAGVAAVTHYTVPMNLATRTQVISSALTRTLFPRLSALRRPEALALASKAHLALAYAYLCVCAPAIMIAPAFLTIWIGPEFAETSSGVAMILFVGVWLNSLGFVPYEFVQTQGRPDITGKAHAIELLPFLVVLWFLTVHFGIVGAAFAWCLRVTLDAVVLCWASRLHLSSILRAIVPIPALIVLAIISNSLGASPAYRCIAAFIVGCTAVVTALLISSEIRDVAKELISARARGRVTIRLPSSIS